MLGILHNTSSSLLEGLSGHHHQHDHDHNHDHDHSHDHNHNHGNDTRHHHQEDHPSHDHPPNSEFHVQADVTTESSVNVKETQGHKTSSNLPPRRQPQPRNQTPAKKQNGNRRNPADSRRPKNFGSSFSLKIPKTDFSCKERAPGYYADMATECQVYYMCQGRGGGRPFLCPEGTKFNQRTFVCDHAARVKCSDASNFFHRNLIIHQESNTQRSDEIRRGQNNLQKRPRIEPSPIFNIKIENTIPSRANGRMAFAPLFEEDRQKNLEKFFKMVTHQIDPSQAESDLQRTSTKENMDASMLLGLPELPPQLKEASTKSPSSSEKVNEIDDYDDYDENGKLQLLPKKQASKSVARFHKDREQPGLKLVPPPIASLQLIGHTMDREDIKFIPNSPMFNISFVTDAKMKTLPVKNDNLFIQTDGGRHGKSGDQSLSLPLHLVPPKPAQQSPLVWISPASLARSPMVLLRRLSSEPSGTNVHLERSLTMNFPGRSSRRFDPQCLACFQDGSNCPRNCIAP